MPDPKKPWEKKYIVEDSNPEKKPWERNFDVDDIDKKKKNSGSTSDGQKSVSAQKTGSSAGQTSTKNTNGFPEIDTNSVAPGVGVQPQPQKSEKKYEEGTMAWNHRKMIENNPDYVAKYDKLKEIQNVDDAKKQEIAKSVEDEFNGNGVWNNIKKFGKEAINLITEPTVTGLSSLGSIFSNQDSDEYIDNAVKKSKIDTDTFTVEKAEAKKEFQEAAKIAKNKKEPIPTFTQDDINKRAIEIKTNNRIKSQSETQLKDYLKTDEETGSKDKTKFLTFEAGKYATIKEKDKLLLEKQNIERNVLSGLKGELTDLQKDITENGLNEENKTEYLEKYNKYQEVIKESIKTHEEYTDNRKNLGDSSENLDVFKRDYGSLKSFIGNVDATISDLSAGAGGAIDYALEAKKNITGQQSPFELASQNIIRGASEDLKSDSDKIRAKIMKPIPVDNINNMSDFGDWFFQSAVAQQVPIYGLIATGNFGVAGIGVTSAGNRFEDMQSKIKSGEENYSNAELMLHPIGYGIAETASAAVDRMLLKNAARVVSSATRPERQMMARGFAKKLFEVTKDVSKGAVYEGLDEGLTQGFENLIDGKPFTDNMKDPIAAGAVMGAVMPLGGHIIAQAVKPFSTDTKIQKSAAEIMRLQNELDNPELSSVAKNAIQENLEQQRGNLESLVKKVIGNVESLSKQQFQEIIRSEKTLANIKEKASELNADETINPELKKQLLENLNDEFSAVNQRRVDLLERGHNVLLERLEPEEVIDLKNRAQRELMKEQNPDGTRNITIDDNQISKRAVQIYNKEKAAALENEANTPVTNTENQGKNEITIPPPPEDYNIVDDEKKPKPSPKPEDSRLIIYTNGKGEKATLNTADIEISEDKNDKLLFTENGNRIGHIEINKPENGEVSIKLSGIFNPSLERRGIGTIMYKQAAELLKSKYNLDLVSDKQRTPDSEALWAKLEREGNAVVIGDKSKGKISDYQYKFVHNETVPKQDTTSNEDVRSGTERTNSNGEETRLQDTVNTPTGKGEVTKKLQQINKEKFGLDEKQSKASAAVMEKTLETMAKRAGISKEEMFDQITFEKGDSETAKQLSKKGNALFQIAGENAELREEIRDNLARAIELEEKGKTPKEIWVATGWEKGVDGKWRVEFNDSAMKLNDDFRTVRGYYLDEAIDYKELFELYPEMKDVSISVLPRLGSMKGAFMPEKNIILINKELTDSEMKSTVLHEIQHIIQSKEGFATGGNPKMAVDYLNSKLKRLQLAKNLPAPVLKAADKLSKSLFSGINVNESKDNFVKEINNIKDKLSEGEWNIYQSIAGEVESRNVQNRMDMTTEERKNTPLSETETRILSKEYLDDPDIKENIGRDEQIILFQGEKGAMLAEDGKFIIYALEDPDVSTPLHELAHVYEHYLTDAEKQTILQDAGHKEWNRETSEHFARGFEKYLADGISPNPEMKKLFDDFKKWLTNIYNGITNSEIDIKLSPEMQKIYDVMLGENNSNRPEINKITYKGSEFTIEKNSDGKTKIFKKDGTEVKEFTKRKTKDGSKRVKNANYYKILALSEGNMTENEINNASKKQIQESIDNFIPTNEYEVALLEIAKGTKFSKESIEKELGNKDSNWASDQFSKNKTATIENAAEGIVSEYQDLNLDEQEVRNALIDVLGSFENIEAVKQQLNDSYQKSIDPYYGLTESDAVNAYEEFMTDSEKALFDSVQAEENLSEEEKLKYYEEQYEKSIGSIPAGERAGFYEEYESGDSSRLSDSSESNETGDLQNGSQRQNSEEKEKSLAKDFLNWLDEIENNLDQFGKENLSSGLPIVVAKASIQAMRAAVKAGQAIADVLQAGLDAMKQSEWYKNLNQTDKNQAEKDFNDAFGNPQIDKDNLRQTENLMNRSASENISEDEAYEEVSKTFEKEREELRNQKPAKEYLRDAYRNFVKRFTDRQYLSKSLLSKSGLRNTRNLIINAHGASGKAKLLFEEAYNEIYKGLTRPERNTLDEIIQAKRFISIDENREARGLEPVSHPNFIDKNKSEKFLSKLEKNLGQEKYKDLEKRAKEYFKTYKNLLQQVYDNGLISKESFDSMSDIDYQPRVFLQFVTDFNGDLAEAKKTNNLETGGLSSEQIKSMSEGDANSLVLNSEWLLTNSLLARQKAIAMNNINKRFMTEEYPKALKRFESIDPKNFKNKEEERFYKYFKELSSKVIDNPYVGETSGGNPKFKYDKTPANFQKAYYYIDGKQHQFFLEQGLYDSWTDNIGGFLDSTAKEILSYATGSALVKAIATGNNPAFPIVNTPRDFMFTTTFSDQYSNFVPKALLQVGKDAFKSFKELRKSDSDVLKKYIKYGGAMDFLSSEGRLKKNSLVGKAIEKAVDPKFKDIAKNVFSKITLSKISEYSEMMFRLGIFQRSIKNQLKDLGLKDISEVTDKQQLDDIYNEAVTSARSILDFNQGGVVTKDLEALVPYINVAFQGGRVAATAFEKDPVGTTSRVLQMATLGSSIPIGISLALLSMFKPDDDEDKSAGEIYLNAMDGISAYQKSKYMNIVVPIKNPDGEYMVIKIAKAQELSPVMSVTDDIYNNMIRSINGQKKKTAGRIIDDAAFTFNSNVMPIDFTSPAGFFTRTPIVKGTLTYTTGYDFFRDEPLSNDIGKVPLAVEGLNNPNVEDFYKKIGEEHGLSPIRSKAFVESLITGPNTNPFVGMLYGGMDAAVSDKDMKKIGEDLFKSVYKSTGKRIISYPSDFNRKLATRKDLQDKIDQINIEKYKMKAEFNQLAKDYINKDVSKEQINEKLKGLDPADRKRMFNKIKDKIRLQDIDGAILDIKYEQGSDVKALMIMHYYGDITDGSKDSKDIIRQMKKAKGVLTPSVLYEYKKLKKELENKK